MDNTVVYGVHYVRSDALSTVQAYVQIVNQLRMNHERYEI
jgi:hypothetical protein